jgi:hypothetical protein
MTADVSSGYKLTRTLPDGTVKEWPRLFPTMRDAAWAVAHCLTDNNMTTRREAARFASQFQDTPPGTAVRHESSGYTFTAQPVSTNAETPPAPLSGCSPGR